VEATILMPPVYDEDFVGPLLDNMREGRDDLSPAEWRSDPKMYPDVCSGGHVVAPSMIGPKLYYSMSQTHLAIQYLGPRYGLPDPGVQTTFQNLYVWDCGPWPGSWPSVPPAIVTQVYTFASIPVDQYTCYIAPAATLPRIVALSTTGWITLVVGGAPERYNYSLFKLTDFSGDQHFEP